MGGPVGVSRGRAEDRPIRRRTNRAGSGTSWPRARRPSPAAGRRRRRAVDRSAITPSPGAADSRRAAADRWNSCSATRSTSPRKGCIRAFAIVCFGSPPSRIPSSTRRRRCGCRPTTSPASSPAPRITRSTSVCRADASRTFARRWSDLGVRTVVRDERHDGSPSRRDLSRRIARRTEGRCRGDAVARHRRAGGDDGVWQDGRSPRG